MTIWLVLVFSSALVGVVGFIIGFEMGYNDGYTQGQVDRV